MIRASYRQSVDCFFNASDAKGCLKLVQPPLLERRLYLQLQCCGWESAVTLLPFPWDLGTGHSNDKGPLKES